MIQYYFHAGTSGSYLQLHIQIFWNFCTHPKVQSMEHTNNIINIIHNLSPSGFMFLIDQLSVTLACVDWHHSFIESSIEFGWWTTIESCSATTFKLLSVIRHAISMILSFRTSRPDISRSIHTILLIARGAFDFWRTPEIITNHNLYLVFGFHYLNKFLLSSINSRSS